MATPGGSSQTTSTEYVVRVPKNNTKRFNLMAFNPADKVDFSAWTQAKMERDLTNKKMYGEEELPEFGAGSEFRRKQREEARRKKYGITLRKFKIEDQPWLLKVNGKAGRRYKGVKKGGVTENACYYVFAQCADGAFEAFPVSSWYNFTAQSKHRTLTAEEAEEEWGRVVQPLMLDNGKRKWIPHTRLGNLFKRNKVLNHFAIMVQKRLKEGGEEVDDADEDGKKGKKGKKKSGDLRISDLEEHLQMSSDSEKDSDDNEEGSQKRPDKGKDKKAAAKKKKKKGSDEEDVLEESDDGDYEGLEVDYFSDESSEEEELDNEKLKQSTEKDVQKGVDEEVGSSDESESEHENEEEKKEEEEEEGKKTPVLEKKEKKKKASDTESSEESDIDDATSSALFIAKKKPSPPKRARKPSGGSRSSSRGNSRPSSPAVESGTSATLRAAANKLEHGTPARKLLAEGMDKPAAKRQKLETPPSSGKSTPSSGDVQLTEDAVRRYLSRKPMTTKDLLKKFQTKKTGLSSNQTVNIIAQILKKLNPERKLISDKMHFFLKESSG